MVHYEVEPAALQPFVPFELDARDGKAYVSLVSFTMRRLRPSFGGRLGRWLFAPIANHNFLNLRTYVRHHGEPGIYFLAEWLPNRLSVLLGPWAYGLPYRLATLERYRVVAHAGEWRYRATTASVALQPAQADSLEEFLLERYTAFTDRGGRLGCFRIWHEPWQQSPIEVSVEADSLPASTGDWFPRAQLVGAVCSPGVHDAWIGRPHVVDQASRPTGSLKAGQAGRLSYFHLLPLLLFPLLAFLLRPHLPAWGFMWALAFGVYAGCKWLSFAQCHSGFWRSLGYLLLWPGMDARAFFDRRVHVTAPRLREWAQAIARTWLGVALLWGLARHVPATHPILTGWVGMIGLVLLLHFGAFHLLSLAWRSLGVGARPLMHSPIRSRSLREFWGRRWNAGFHDLAHRFLYEPLRPKLGVAGATLAVFLVSGLIHELVISVPAGAGYGLPTAYFFLQGLALLAQRKRTSRVFTLLVTAVPAFWLFHPPFVTRVILPFLRAIGAL